MALCRATYFASITVAPGTGTSRSLMTYRLAMAVCSGFSLNQVLEATGRNIKYSASCTSAFGLQCENRAPWTRRVFK